MLTNGSIQEITAEKVQEESVWLSPIGVLFGNSSDTLLVHWIGNSLYAKPRFQILNMPKEHSSLKGIRKVNKFDMIKCYNQYPVTANNYDKLSFTFNGHYYQCKTLVYGPSQCVYLVEAMNDLIVNYCRHKRSRVILRLIDDFLEESRDGEQSFLKSLLTDLGYFLNEEKEALSKQSVEFCGFKLDLGTQRVKLADKPGNKILEDIDYRKG